MWCATPVKFGWCVYDNEYIYVSVMFFVWHCKKFCFFWVPCFVITGVSSHFISSGCLLRDTVSCLCLLWFFPCESGLSVFGFRIGLFGCLTYDRPDIFAFFMSIDYVWIYFILCFWQLVPVSISLCSCRGVCIFYAAYVFVFHFVSLYPCTWV